MFAQLHFSHLYAILFILYRYPIDIILLFFAKIDYLPVFTTFFVIPLIALSLDKFSVFKYWTVVTRLCTRKKIKQYGGCGSLDYGA